ncbi:MAG: hypothetical protein Q7J68_07440 [Thermoplasmata archaeon]|nr:hypothetical protein [Thermoplasmata archaeon]
MARKKGSSISKDSNADSNNASSLYNWVAIGYLVDPILETMRSGDSDAIDKSFKEFSEKVARLEKVLDQLENLNFNEKHEMFSQHSDKLNDPLQVESLESLATSLKITPRLKELKAELASLNIVGFEEEAKKIHILFTEETDLDVVENEIKKLQKKIKEKFFEEAFEDAVEPPVQATKFVAETIFLLHKDGTLLSVKSKKSPTELDKKLMSRMVMAIKEQMTKAFKEGEHVHSLTYEGHTIILEDSTHVYAAVVIVGESKPVMYRVILKAIQIMENKLATEFTNWKGDRNSLENLDKYTSAIFQALDKLS